MAIYFVQLMLICIAGAVYQPQKNTHRKKIYLIFVFLMLVLVSAMRKYTIGIDLEMHYVANFAKIAHYKWVQIPLFSERSQYSLGYCYFLKFLSVFSSSPQFYIVVTSVLIFGGICLFIYYKSDDVLMSVYIFIAFCTNYMFMNIIAQALAICIVLLGYLALSNQKMGRKRYIIFAIAVLLATGIHTSALICFSFIVLDKLKFKWEHMTLLAAGTVFVFAFYDKLYLFAAQLLGREKYISYIWNESENRASITDQSKIMFVLTLLPLVLACFTLLKKNTAGFRTNRHAVQYQLAKNDSLLMYLSFFAVLCRLLLFRMNIINRVTYYFLPFTLLLYPRAIQEIKKKDVRIVVTIVVYIVNGLYFIWMSKNYAAEFYGTIPYVFFWN